MNTRTYTYLVISTILSCFATTGSNAMIASLARATQKDTKKEVCIIGLENRRLGIPDEKETFFEHVERWSQDKEQTSWLICETKNIWTMMPHFEELRKRGELAIGYECLCYAFKHQLARNNLRFLHMPSVDEIDNQFGFFMQILNNQQRRSKLFKDLDIYPKLAPNEIEQLFKSSKKERTAFFSPGGGFCKVKDHFEKELRSNPHIKIFTIQDYLDYNIAIIETIKVFSQFHAKMDEDEGKTEKADKQKKYFEKLITSLNVRLDNLRRFFREYAENDFSRTGLDACLAAIAKKQSFIDGNKEIHISCNESLLCFAKVMQRLLLCIPIYDRIIICVTNNIALNLQILLEVIGFDKKSVGYSSASIGEQVSTSQRAVSHEDLEAFLKEAFSGNVSQKKDLTTKAPSKPTAPLYYNKQTGQYQKAPTFDQNNYTCRICGHESVGVLHFAVCPNQKSFCSFGCFLKDLLAKQTVCQDVALLNSSHVNNAKDKAVLKKVAALCAVQKTLFVDAISQETSALYSLNHAQIIELLKQLSEFLKQDNSSPEALSWQAAVGLAKFLGIDIPALQGFYQVYALVKQKYLTSLLEQARTNSYEALLRLELSAPFDGSRLLQTQQGKRIAILNELYKFSTTTTPRTYYNLYSDLHAHIAAIIGQRIDTTQELTLGIANKKSLEDIFKELGIEQKAKAKSQQHTPNATPDDTRACEDDASSDSEEETAAPLKPLLSVEIPTHRVTPAELANFKPAGNKLKLPTKKIACLFCSQKPYEITLFRAKQFVKNPDTKALATWKNRPEWQEACRVKILFGLVDNMRSLGPIIVLTDAAKQFRIDASSYGIDSTLAERLDIRHLFSREVDMALNSHGIIETVGDLIQVSIPGQITSDNTIEIGFFQYSFNSSWKLIHRYFKRYDQDLKEGYISPQLRSALLEFLKAHFMGNNDYAAVIKHLENILG